MAETAVVDCALLSHFSEVWKDGFARPGTGCQNVGSNIHLRSNKVQASLSRTLTAFGLMIQMNFFHFMA